MPHAARARFASVVLAFGLALPACSEVRVVGHDGGDDGSDVGDTDPSTSPICGEAAPIRFEVTAQNSEVDVFDVAPLPDCASVVVGSYAGSVDMAGAPVSSTTWEGFVARLDAAGRVEWLVSIGTPQEYGDSVYDVEVDEAGNTYLSGHVGAPSSVGSLTLTGDYLLSLDPTGAPRWSRDLEVAAWGLKLRHGGIDAFTSAGESGIGRLRLDSSDGAPIESTSLVSGVAGVFDVATRGDTTALAFTFRGTVEAFGQSLVARDDGPTPVDTPGVDLAVATFAYDGSLRWMRTFDEVDFSPYLGRVALGPGDAVALAFDYWGQIDLGAGQHQAAPIGPGMAGLVAFFDATGQTRKDFDYGRGEFVFPSGMAWDTGGTLTLAGELYNASLDLGEGEVSTEPDQYLGFESAFDTDGELIDATAREGYDGMFQAEPGVLFWVDRPTPDGDLPRVIVVRREGVRPAPAP